MEAANASLDQLYDKYAPLLFSEIIKIIPDDQGREDALAEVFFYLHQHLSDFHPTNDFFAIRLINYVRRIAICNLCKMQADNRYCAPLETMTLGERTVFALHCFRSFSTSQIVAVLRLRHQTVVSLLHSAKMKVNHASSAAHSR